jgi:hypothetical protein
MDAYIEIGLLAKRVSELEALRIADENRIRSVEQAGDAREAMLDSLKAVNTEIKKLERQAVLALEKSIKQTPGVGEWVQATPGVGLKTVGRLIGAIGNPVMNFAEDRPRRGPAELWAYMGLHVTDNGTAPRRKKGELANWSTEAKTRAFLVAEGCVKAVGGETSNGVIKPRSPYRDVYDSARMKHAGGVHKTECPRCGPKGKPAQPGSPLSDGHAHARAMREVMKELVKDLFLTCRDQQEHDTLRFYAIDSREPVAV